LCASWARIVNDSASIHFPQSEWAVNWSCSLTIDFCMLWLRLYSWYIQTHE
jgi:hypothetical protein